MNDEACYEGHIHRRRQLEVTTWRDVLKFPTRHGQNQYRCSEKRRLEGTL